MKSLRTELGKTKQPAMTMETCCFTTSQL